MGENLYLVHLPCRGGATENYRRKGQSIPFIMQEGQGTRFCGRQVGESVCCQFGLSSNTVSFRGFIIIITRRTAHAVFVVCCCPSDVWYYNSFREASYTFPCRKHPIETEHRATHAQRPHWPCMFLIIARGRESKWRSPLDKRRVSPVEWYSVVGLLGARAGAADD